MEIVGIVQARLGSTRLPGKVLMDLAGQSVLARVIGRAGQAKTLGKLVIATTDLAADDPIAHTCQRQGWNCFRGSEQDVLDRYYRAALAYSAEAVVRITADCPLIDPEIIDLIVADFLNQHVDYATNDFPPTYPRGLDAEVFTVTALARAWKEARESHEREHVTPFLYQHRELFSVASVQAESDYSGYRWTLDTPEDLQLVREIYERLGGRNDFGWRQVLHLVEGSPELTAINAHVIQKSLHQV
jgi:spore coat polysaccharide biosynthesis protein SpsF (cytidylyltransferase family)